jgi:hypothetical protein
MALQLRTQKRTYRVPLYRDGGEAVFVVDPDTPEEVKERLERFTFVERVRGEVKEKVDWFKMKLDRVVKVIAEWEGIEDEAGQAVACTRENKIAVYLNNPGVIDEVLAEAEDLAQEEKKRVEGEAKNSATGSKRR